VITGNLVRTYTHKGVTDDSTWARAQAWAMLGLAQACQHDPGYFTSPAIQVCDWWCEHRPSATSPTGTSTQSQPWGDATRPAGILGDGCYNRRIGLALRNELVWGTHFLLEALLTLTGQIDTALV
jgi:unsaturated chondroitin disaccharide hydrolase